MASGFLFPNLCVGEIYIDQTPTSEDSDTDMALSNQVRQTYFHYLYRMIEENASFVNASEESVSKIAQKIEITAVKRALRTEHYREEMLKAIRNVQDKTVVNTVLKGLRPKADDLNQPRPTEIIKIKNCTRYPQDTSKDAHRVYNSICAQMEKMFQEESDIPSSPEDSSLCPILWNSEYHIQKSLLIQQLNVISKFNPPKYLRLTAKINKLFNNVFTDDSLCGTPEPFDEIQRHCKKRIAQMIKHYIRPYYILKHFQGDPEFKKFVRGCVHRLSQATPHIGPRAIFKGISNAFDDQIGRAHV